MDRDLEALERSPRAWRVDWSAAWVGALTALAVGLVIGLIGYAVGVHDLATSRTIDWQKVRLIGLAWSVGGAFFAFVSAGWVAARIAGTERAEAAIVHGAIAWLVALPLLIALAALGGTVGFGSWYAGLGGVPAWAGAVTPVDPELAARFRNTALATVAALLLGLVGAVLGGWMASG
jgi:hypothetical protein